MSPTDRSGLLAGLLALLVPALAGGGTLEAAARWGGRFVPGAPTEVVVALSSPRGGNAQVRIDGAVTVLLSAVLTADTPQRLALPVRPGPDGSLHLSGELPDGDRPTLTMRLQPQSRPLSVGTAPGLPETAAGYGPVGRVTLAAADLGGLSDAQTAALADYLGGCGALRVPDLDPAGLAALRAAAGCGGRAIGADGATPLAVPRPAAPALAARQTAPAARALAGLFLPYLALLGLLALGARRWRHRPQALLLVPPAALLLAAIGLPPLAAHIDARVIGEQVAGDPTYRWQADLHATGGGRGRPPLRLPAGSDLPLAADGAALLVRLAADGGAATTVLVDLPAGLMQQRRVRLTGVAPSPWSLRLAVADDGVVLHNAGPAPTPAGWLVLGRRARPVAGLAPGERRTLALPQQPAPVPIDLPTSDETTALLLPLPGPGPLASADPRVTGSGWLLVRGSP